jgi:hypothetical protein
MSTINVKGDGNFVFQGQSAGNKITINGGEMKITSNQATLKETIIEMIDLDLQGVFSKLDNLNWGNRKGMYIDLKKEFIDKPVGFSLSSLRSRLKILISYVDLSGLDLHVIGGARSWESELKTIISENNRVNEDVVQRATNLLSAFRDYYDAKDIRPLFDRSGEKLAEIEQQFQSFKNDLNKSNFESVSQFIDRVMNHLGAAVPNWPSIGEAYTLCVGRGLKSDFLESNIRLASPDNQAKLNAVKIIETFLEKL